jgi:hypothetical protein
MPAQIGILKRLQELQDEGNDSGGLPERAEAVTSTGNEWQKRNEFQRWELTRPPPDRYCMEEKKGEG